MEEDTPIDLPKFKEIVNKGQTIFKKLIERDLIIPEFDVLANDLKSIYNDIKQDPEL